MNSSKFQVTASDADIDRPNNIIYFLTGPGIDPENPANSNFDINKATGEVFVLKVSVRRTNFHLYLRVIFEIAFKFHFAPITCHPLKTHTHTYLITSK
jgi:hypothetical protein